MKSIRPRGILTCSSIREYEMNQNVTRFNCMQGELTENTFIFSSFFIYVFNPLTAKWGLRALIDFTLSNARRFYSSMGNPLDGKGLSNRVFEVSFSLLKNHFLRNKITKCSISQICCHWIIAASGGYKLLLQKKTELFLYQNI